MPTKCIFIVFVFLYLCGCASSFRGAGEFHKVSTIEKLFIASISKTKYTKLPLPNSIPLFRNITKPNNISNIDLESAPNFDWPVDQAIFVRGFNDNYQKSNNTFLIQQQFRPHVGIDLAAPINTPIFAAESGKVIFASNGFSGYGRLIIIEHENNWASFYSHLNKINIKEGSFVKKGQEIAKMGQSGKASGVHLHFELRYSLLPVDPLFVLNAKKKYNSISKKKSLALLKNEKTKAGEIYDTSGIN